MAKRSWRSWFGAAQSISSFDQEPSRCSVNCEATCANCPIRDPDFSGTIDYYWAHTDDPRYSDERQYLAAVQYVEPLKDLHLFQCRQGFDCRWLLDEHRRFLNFVHGMDIPRLITWSRNTYRPTTILLEKLLDIRANPQGGYDEECPISLVPCRAELVSGAVAEYCVVKFVKSPYWIPSGSEALYRAGEYADDIDLRFVETIADIFPSDYALPFEVRERSAKAMETTNMFYPTPVAWKGKHRYTLNGEGLFLHHGDVLGKDISLEGDEWFVDASMPLLYSNGRIDYGDDPMKKLPLMYICADWDEAYPEPFKPSYEFHG